jgi:signal peptidase II
MFRWFALSGLIIVLDQLSKWLATTKLDYAQPVQVLPFFDFTLLHNMGAAFSFLSDAGGWQRWFLAAVSLGASVFIIIWLLRLNPVQRWLAGSLSLVLGGALGNLIDRVQYGYVVDFISVHYQQYYFPAFNIADSAITIGALMLIIDMIKNPPDKAAVKEGK